MEWHSNKVVLLYVETGVLLYKIANKRSETPDKAELCEAWYEDEKVQTPVPYFGLEVNYNTPQYLEFINWFWEFNMEGDSCPCELGQAWVNMAIT